MISIGTGGRRYCHGTSRESLSMTVVFGAKGFLVDGAVAVPEAIGGSDCACGLLGWGITSTLFWEEAGECSRRGVSSNSASFWRSCSADALAFI